MRFEGRHRAALIYEDPVRKEPEVNAASALR